MKPAGSFLSLTFAGVFVEITYCVWGITQGQALWIVPLVLGAYHGGYVLVRTPVLNRYGFPHRSLVVIAILIIATGTSISAWPIVAIGILLFSTSLQFLRRSLKEQVKVESHTKNVTKALAMVSGSVGASPWLTLVIVLGAGLLAIVIRRVSVGSLQQKRMRNLPIRKDLLWFEFLHHAHYFAYCYTFWVLLGVYFTLFVGPLFLIG